MEAVDYRQFSSLESYLFEKVGKRFRSTGLLDPIDLFLIFVWKANRAKTRMLSRLLKKAADIRDASDRIGSGLSVATTAEDKLRFLMVDWGFALPMASAVLTVLYPDEFTVYDVRVCSQLNDFQYLSNHRFSAALWDAYSRFVEAVRAKAPSGFSLRDSDRYLWGKSVYEDARKLIEAD